MFVFFYYGIVLISKVATAGRNFISDTVSKHNATINKHIGYWDHSGIYHNTDTGEPIYHTVLNNGDRVIKNWNGDIIKNISENERKLRISQHNLNETGNLKLEGRYIDIFSYDTVPCLEGKIPKKACVYTNENHDRFLKVNTSGVCSQKAYINLESGEYIMINNKSKSDQEWLDLYNHNIKTGKKNFLCATTAIECMY